jgi:hypothetical protein
MRHVACFRPSCFSDILLPGSYVVGCKHCSSYRPSSKQKIAVGTQRDHANMKHHSIRTICNIDLVRTSLQNERLHYLSFAMPPHSCHVSLRNRLQQYMYMRLFLASERKSWCFYLRYVTESLLHVTPVILYYFNFHRPNIVHISTDMLFSIGRTAKERNKFQCTWELQSSAALGYSQHWKNQSLTNKTNLAVP